MDCPPTPKKRKQFRPDQRLCPHCEEIVSYKTFRTHKRLYFNSKTNSWFGIKQSCNQYQFVANEGAALGEKVLSESPPGEEVQEETDVDLPPSDVASFSSY